MGRLRMKAVHLNCNMKKRICWSAAEMLQQLQTNYEKPYGVFTGYQS